MMMKVSFIPCTGSWKPWGHGVEHAYTLNDGLEKLHSKNFDILLLDVNLPDGSGLDIISDVMALPFHPQIIIMTAFSDPDGAELAIEIGAWDYIEKPVSSNRLKLQISRALEFQAQKREIRCSCFNKNPTTSLAKASTNSTLLKASRSNCK